VKVLPALPVLAEKLVRENSLAAVAVADAVTVVAVVVALVV
jgi:hypothetical protein